MTAEIVEAMAELDREFPAALVLLDEAGFDDFLDDADWLGDFLDRYGAAVPVAPGLRIRPHLNRWGRWKTT